MKIENIKFNRKNTKEERFTVSIEGWVLNFINSLAFV